MPVDVQRLRIERHVGEQHVVHLRHGARVAVLVGLADLEILEIEAAALVPLDRVNHRFLRKILRQRGVWEPPLPFIYHNSPMLGRLAGNACVRVITHKPRSSQGATRWPFIRLLPAHHRSPARSARRAQSTGDQLRVSAHHREDRIQFQPDRAGLDLVGERAVSVHRPDLARHDEAGRGGARARPLCRCDRASADGRYAVSDPRMRAEILRLRNDPKASAMMAGRSRATMPALVRSARPPADRRRTLHRAFSRRRWRRQTDQRRVEKPARERGVYVSARRSGQRSDFLRRVRPRAQHRRGLRKTDPTVRFSARCRRGAARRDRWRRSACADFAGAAIAAAGDGRGRASEIVAKRTSDPHRGGGAAAGAACINSDAARHPFHRPIRRGVTQAFAQAGEKLPPPPPARPSFQSMFTDRVSQPLAQTVNNLWGPAHERIVIADAGSEGVRSVHRHQAQRTQAFGRQGLICSRRAPLRSLTADQYSMVNALLSLVR